LENSSRLDFDSFKASGFCGPVLKVKLQQFVHILGPGMGGKLEGISFDAPTEKVDISFFTSPW
jgi:hypothetical protein